MISIDFAKGNKNPSPIIFAVFIFAAVVIGLSACGGGGGSSAPKPSLSISQPTVMEGDSGTVELMFTVTLSEVSEQTLTVD